MKNAKLSNYLFWLASEVSENSAGETRPIIYCQTINQCALVYTTTKIPNTHLYQWAYSGVFPEQQGGV